MPSVPDFETLFSQVQLFISTCNGEHIRYATDTCKLIIFPLPECIFFCSVYIFNILLLFFVIVASSCWALPSANKCTCGKKTGKKCYSNTHSSVKMCV